MVLVHDAGFAGTWLTQADGTISWADLDTVSEGFSVVGSGDFDGDGTDDIAMINGDAYVGIWGVSGGTFDSWTLTSWDNLTNWTYVSSGDFSGDGTDDMMWYNPTNNYYCCWQIENMEIGSKQIFTTIA